MDLGKLNKMAVERSCKECGKVFRTDPSGYPTALVLFCDHLTEHQPDGAAWTRAYKIIEANRPKRKQD